MRVRYTRRAVADLDQIADHLSPRSTQGARNVRAATTSSVQDLVTFPRLGRMQTTEATRKLVVRKYPYLVYYTVDDDAEEIAILAIQHSSRERELTDR